MDSAIIKACQALIAALTQAIIILLEKLVEKAGKQ